MCHFHRDEKLYIFTKTNNKEAFRPIFFNLQAVLNEELVCWSNTKDREVPTQLRNL
jgi:citrate lyase synthetase